MSSAGFRVEPIDASFGAVVSGLKLATLDEATFRELYDCWLEYALLIFPDQHLSNEEQVAFAKRFGELESEGPISNLNQDGSVRVEDDSDPFIQLLKGNMGWHHDSTYMDVQAKGAVFTAHAVPSERGETGWADMRAAYEALDPALRERVAELSAYHSLTQSQCAAGFDPTKSDLIGYDFKNEVPKLRPLVKVHPETGRPNLVIGRHAYGIPGLESAESERLLRELADFACQPPRIYHHPWTAGDAVLWDNRRLMHQARPWDMREPRVMYHARIAGDPKSEFASPA